MNIVSSDTRPTPAPVCHTIEFPPRPKTAYAVGDSSGYWVGGVLMTDGSQQVVLEAVPGRTTHYALVAKMHEFASRHHVDLHVRGPVGPEEVLRPMPA